MTKADMLSQLDQRLRKVKQRSKLPFDGDDFFWKGGNFEDIIQQRPVKVRFIFKPTNENYYCLIWWIHYGGNPKSCFWSRIKGTRETNLMLTSIENWSSN